MSDTEPTYTYILKMGAESPYIGSDTEDEVDLVDYGYSDEEWDAMTEREQNKLLDEWSEENFWNSGYSYYGKVEKP